MKADASSGVTAEVGAGANIPAFEWVMAGLLVVAALFLLTGLALVLAGSSNRRRAGR